MISPFDFAESSPESLFAVGRDAHTVAEQVGSGLQLIGAHGMSGNFVGETFHMSPNGRVNEVSGSEVSQGVGLSEECGGRLLYCAAVLALDSELHDHTLVIGEEIEPPVEYRKMQPLVDGVGGGSRRQVRNDPAF